MKLTPQKLEGLPCAENSQSTPYFNRFRLIHPCDGRTDRETDGR